MTSRFSRLVSAAALAALALGGCNGSASSGSTAGGALPAMSAAGNTAANAPPPNPGALSGPASASGATLATWQRQPAAAVAPVLAINAGGAAADEYVADTGFSGGATTSTTKAIDTSAVTDPAPIAVYQTERYGDFTYTLSRLTPSAPYTVRLDEVEVYFNAAGHRNFDVVANGATVLSGVDLYKLTGAQGKAISLTFTASADTSGTILLHFVNHAGGAKVDGIAVYGTGPSPGPSTSPSPTPSGSPSPVPSSTPVGTMTTPHMASTFNDAVGVDANLGNTGSLQGQLENMILAAKIRHMRDTSMSTTLAEDLYNRGGVRNMGEAAGGCSVTSAQVDAFLATYPHAEAVEPANESDGCGNGTITMTQTIYSTIHNNASYLARGVLATGPSLAHPNDAANFAQNVLAGSVDVGNVHMYQAGMNPEGAGGSAFPNGFKGDFPSGTPCGNSSVCYGALDAEWLSGIPKSKVWTTEQGWNSRCGSNPNNSAWTPDSPVNVAYAPRALLYSYWLGLGRSYDFTLQDFGNADGPNPGIFDCLGLIHINGTPKPQWNSISNLLNLLDDPGSSFTVQPLGFAVTGNTSHVYTLLFEKRNGTYYVVLWLGTSMWNGSSVVNVTPQSVTLQAARPAGTASVSTFSSTDGSLQQQSQAWSGSLTLSVGGMPIVVKLP
jgi:hypothetical protein